MGVFVFSARHPEAGAAEFFLASAPTDSSAVLLPVVASQLCRTNEPCLSRTNPRIAYSITAYDLVNGGVDNAKGTAKYNVWSSAISQGGFVEALAPRGVDTSTVITVNAAEWKVTPAKGVMIVTFDNESGEKEAQLIDVQFDH